MKIVVNNLNISINENQNQALKNEIVKLGINSNNILNLTYLKRSIDSRNKKQIKFVYNVEVTLKKNINIDNMKNVKILENFNILKFQRKKAIKQVAIVGAGPAGLFSALRLCELGIIPIIYERGEKIDDRDKTIDKFFCDRVLNINSNIQFGEGGAGTYSDGKLNTRVKSQYIEKIFSELVDNGADEKIMWDYKPHIGTDILKKVIKNLRAKIIKLGGIFHFNTLVDNILIVNNEVKGLKIRKTNISNVENETVFFNHIILAIGHSSRDTYRMLSKNGVFMENKPFAIGARIEHYQKDINVMQYGNMATHPNLENATYNLTYNNRAENRGVFSFCMCPGGVIVNASSEENGTLVNGMSYSKRDGKFSNSAIVVGVKANEFGDKLFSGMEYQRMLENKTYEIIGTYGALYQNSMDFLKGKVTKKNIESSYEMDLKSYDFNQILPDVIVNNMKKAIDYWGKTHKNFIGKNANLIGLETRTSAPIKITRNNNGESISIKGLYPVGEGAGYAGGIISAGIDGIKIVNLAFAEKLEN